MSTPARRATIHAAVLVTACMLLSACGSGWYASVDDEPTPPTSTTEPGTITPSPTATSTSTSPSSRPGRSSCTAEAIGHDIGRPIETVPLCEGEWAVVGLPVDRHSGDTSVIVHRVAGHWQHYTSVPSQLCREEATNDGMPALTAANLSPCPPGRGGRTTTGGSAGPSTQPRDSVGATGLITAVRTADGRVVSASAPACDGRGILILFSAVEGQNGTAGAPLQTFIASKLDANPGARFATPAQCASLRGSLNGARIYPIYLDFGHDRAALCQAKRTRGGNARLLRTSVDYSDPC